MTSTPLMACGHAANATNGEGKDCCVICVGITPLAEKIAPAPNLEGRIAKCVYGEEGGKYGRHPDGAPKPSSTSLAFFEHHPKLPFDAYYCGCWGWD